MPPWINPWLMVAMFSSFALHFLILYVPALATILSIVPLDANEWALVCACAAPVWLIDEVLKFIGRNFIMEGKTTTEKQKKPAAKKVAAAKKKN